jgi:hypothetical protein
MRVSMRLMILITGLVCRGAEEGTAGERWGERDKEWIRGNG